MIVIPKFGCVLAVCLLFSGCASPCNNVGLFMLYPMVAFDPDTYRGRDGSSFTHAIVLNGPKGETEIAAAESAYIVKKFKVNLEDKGGPPAHRKVQSEGQVYFTSSHSKGWTESNTRSTST